MQELIANILDKLRTQETLNRSELDSLVRMRSAKAHDGRRVFAKKRILPFYLAVKAEAGETWQSWDVDEELHERFVKTLQMKPRRSASGVATITVITKPWPCSNSCIYCPNDPAMPKSYLSNEPACQRAAFHKFSPYQQVQGRLRALMQMGHTTDKVELIVLGGTWFDYPSEYRYWFTCELFRALNEANFEQTVLPAGEADSATSQARRAAHDDASDLSLGDPSGCQDETCKNSPSDDELQRVFSSASGEAFDISSIVSLFEKTTLAKLQKANEAALCRCVGLVFETRPNTINVANLTELRLFGCTKVQVGVQSIQDELLRINHRYGTSEEIASAFKLCRLFGFKIHAHFMLNLLGATPQSDEQDYRRFMYEPAYIPDEVKLYPCALVASAPLVDKYKNGEWKPYTEEQLIGLLSQNMKDTPAYVRISRMIRDISSSDILVGNKKTNLRQLVDENLADCASEIQEIRFREIASEDVDLDKLSLEEISYTTHVTKEHFLQWLTPTGKIAGFLRLSLPQAEGLQNFNELLPIQQGEAMIREVHIYGVVAQISKKGVSAQHRGLGRALIKRASEIARCAGYDALNVISAVGTRQYYRKLGFCDCGFYQQLSLRDTRSC